jgi:outer membrane protein assembly factor BamB
MRGPRTLLLTTLLALVAAAPVRAADTDWNPWRGPNNTGCAPDANPPAEWSETKNIRWKTAIPGKGHASPVVVGDRVYLMTAVELPGAPDETSASEPVAVEPQDRGRGGGRGRERPPIRPQKLVVLAVDAKTGAIAWQTAVREAMPHEALHPTSTYASASVVTDGAHLWAFFGSAGLYCLDLDGRVVWEKDLGDMSTRREFGEGASPALHGDTIVIPWDHEGDSFIAALDKHTGDERWRRDRDEPTTWATPAIAVVDGRAQAIMPGTTACIAYDLETGDEIWRSKGLTLNCIPTPIVGHGMVYLTSGFRGSALRAIDLAKAKGDVDGTDAVVWEHDRGTPYIPSPMLSGPRIYFLRSGNGIVSCFDALTGKEHYAGQRLDTVKNVYASIVGAGGRVYVCGREGNCEVLEDGPEFKHLATNTLDAGINASPAIVGDVMYVRTNTHLYCIGTATDSPGTATDSPE